MTVMGTRKFLNHSPIQSKSTGLTKIILCFNLGHKLCNNIHIYIMDNPVIIFKPSDTSSAIQAPYLNSETVQLDEDRWEEVQPVLPHIAEWKMDWLRISMMPFT